MPTTITNCRYCGMSHGIKCPTVKAIEYFEDGVTVKRVEFVTAADYQPMLPPLSYSLPPSRSWPCTSTSMGWEIDRNGG